LPGAQASLAFKILAVAEVVLVELVRPQQTEALGYLQALTEAQPQERRVELQAVLVVMQAQPTQVTAAAAAMRVVALKWAVPVS
jgi:hypothetical protein